MVLLSLRGLLANSQQDDLARLADFAYGNSSAVAETCGDELEVEARVV